MEAIFTTKMSYSWMLVIDAFSKPLIAQMSIFYDVGNQNDNNPILPAVKQGLKRARTVDTNVCFVIFNFLFHLTFWHRCDLLLILLFLSCAKKLKFSMFAFFGASRTKTVNNTTTKCHK